MAEAFQYDVFLSHNSKDKPRVCKLANQLKAAGLRVWFDEWVIKPGDDIYLAIERGLEASRTLVLCLSPAALGSDWVGLERNTVLFRDPANTGRRFIPLLLADCKLPDALRRYKYVDYREESDETFHDIVKACSLEEPKRDKPVASGSWFLGVLEGTTGVGLATEMISKLRGSGSLSGVGLIPRTIGGVPQGFHLLHLLTPQEAPHRCTTTRMAWSPDGQLIAAPSHGGKIWIWRVPEEKPIAILEGHREAAYGVTWSSDCKTLASCSWDESIRLWDVSTGESRIIGTGLRRLNALSCRPNSSLVAAGAEGGPVILFDMESGDCVGELWGHQGNINNLAWSPDGQYLAGASGDCSLRIWNHRNRMPILTLKGHSDWAFAVSWSPDSQLLASSSWDQTVRCWNVRAGRELCVMEGHEDKVTSCSFSADGRVLASKAKDNTVRLWRSDTWEQIVLLKEESSKRNSPDDVPLAVGIRLAAG